MQARDLLDVRLGPGTYDQLARDEQAAAGTLLPGIWYEVDPLVRVLRTAARTLGTDLEALTADIARSNAFADLPSIYRVFLRVAQPKRVLHFVPQLWRTYVDAGDGVVVQNETSRFVGHCTNVPPALAPWARGCWLGFLPAAIELCGGVPSTAKITRTWREPLGSEGFQLDIFYS